MTGDLTAFVVSSGANPCFSLCLEALNQQTLKCEIVVIKDVSPMSRAFQRMIDDCKTRYYVEVDEDMVLKKNALEVMYRKIKESDAAIVAFKLIDVHPDQEIYGVKIYDHDVLKNYPYDFSVMSCEVEQIERMEKDGHKVELRNEILGEHAPEWSDNGIFERYHNLMDKFKQFKYPWIEELPRKLLNKFKKDPSDKNLYALLGIYTSIISDKIQEGEKDFRKSMVNSYKNG